MSSKALNWVMEHIRTDSGAAQAILLIIADGANADGVAYHLDPERLADRSCQSRATVFRRLYEMRRFGVLSWPPPVGGRYEFALQMHRTVKYDRKMVEAMRKEQSEEAAAEAEIAARDDPETESQIETQSPPETSESTVETGESQPETPESHCCDSYTESKDSKDSKIRGGGGDAGACEADVDRFREAKILTEQIASLAGYPNPEYWPPSWCTAQHRVAAMLAEGWDAVLMLATARAVMAGKRDGPPSSIDYFVKAFARAHALSQTPLPKVVVAEQEIVHVANAGPRKESLVEVCDRLAASGWEPRPVTPRPLSAGAGGRPDAARGVSKGRGG